MWNYAGRPALRTDLQASGGTGPRLERPRQDRDR